MLPGPAGQSMPGMLPAQGRQLGTGMALGLPTRLSCWCWASSCTAETLRPGHVCRDAIDPGPTARRRHGPWPVHLGQHLVLGNQLCRQAPTDLPTHGMSPALGRQLGAGTAAGPWQPTPTTFQKNRAAALLQAAMGGPGTAPGLPT